MTPEEGAAARQRARQEAEDARDEALRSPTPDPEGLTEGVFAE